MKLFEMTGESDSYRQMRMYKHLRDKYLRRIKLKVDHMLNTTPQMTRLDGVEIKLHLLLTSAQNGGEWTYSHFTVFFGPASEMPR
jgi:hypothetical protein